MPAYADKKDKS